MMKPKLMIEPSSWLGSGVRLEQVGELRLFKFTDNLQARSDELLERNKIGNLTLEEQAELDGISELAQIFTHANSILASDSNPETGAEVSRFNPRQHLFSCNKPVEFLHQ
jgi:hypothetical protein